MAGGVAHELNNPLTILKLKSTMADKLLSTENPNLEEARKCLTSIKDTSSRVATVVDALRLLGRNTDDDKVAPTTLPSLVGSALAICEGNIRLRSINLQVTHADETATVECKPAQIGQVILGLLSNAIDAVAPAPDKWIQIETRALESQIEIAITDSGGGIPPEVREKIMKPFFSTKSKDKAIGLGLSFAREMVQKHRGEFFLDPEATRTRFVIRLPKVST
jgi:C4-dicarboxylate-specific signal transduction histidine kinase